MAFRGVLAILTARDWAANVAFWRDKLGFTVGVSFGQGGAGGAGYVEVERDQARLALTADPTKGGGRSAYIFVDDVDAVFAEFVARQVQVIRGPTDQPYGCRDFSLYDAAGNHVCFGQKT